MIIINAPVTIVNNGNIQVGIMPTNEPKRQKRSFGDVVKIITAVFSLLALLVKFIFWFLAIH